MKYMLVMNPGSRGGSSEKQFENILQTLGRAGVSYDYNVTASLEDASRFSKEANLKGYDVIVAVGGDGTVNRVLKGFFDEKGRRISNSRMGIIYTGTSPDFCKSYGIPTDREMALKVLLEGRSKKISLGKIELCREPVINAGNPSGIFGKNTVVEYFACCANIGIGAALARNANSGIRKYAGDSAGTFLALLKTLAQYKPCTLTVASDGHEKRIENVYNISIGKTLYIASGIKVKNSLLEDDRRFYCMTVKNVSIWNLADILKKIYGGRDIPEDDNIRLCYGKAFEIHENSINTEVEFDGDAAGFLPCRIEMAQDGIDLIVQ